MTPSPGGPPVASLPELIERAHALATSGRRRLLGITGPPAAGKSRLAAHLAATLTPNVAHVPMDGFHLADVTLDRLGLRETKGTIDTFDGGGFVALLRRLRDADEPVVYAPGFERNLEQPLAAAISVPREVPLIVTEGNYLLVDRPPWNAVRDLLDECWYVETSDDAVRSDRLLRRHVQSGKQAAAAQDWMARVDTASAAVVAATRDRADVIGLLD